MNIRILFIAIVLVIANILLSTIISAYPTFNVIVTSVVIIVNAILIILLKKINLKDAFKYSLTVLLGVIGMAELLLGAFAQQQYQNNWFLIVLILAGIFEIILLLAANFVSSKVN